MKSPNQFLFVAVRNIVMRGREEIARAKTSMWARRLAKALNREEQKS